MNQAQENRSKTRWSVLVIVTVMTLVAVLGASAWARYSARSASGNDMPTFEVRQGPLTISVVQSGTIQALEQEILKSEVEGQTTIIFLIPEGTLVKEGELLVELDASRLQDDQVEQQIRVQNAEAAFIRARENLAVAKNQAKSDISKGELDYRFAQEDVTQYVDGEHPQERKEAESKITLAKEELERAAEKLNWSQKLNQEKYISQTELETDKLTYNRAKLGHELAVAALDLLINYTSKRMLAQLESDVEQTAMALERVRLQAGADIVQAEADLRAKEAERRQQEGKLAKVKRQITKTKIYATRNGLVVYSTSAKGSWHGNQEPLDEGQGVRERQELIYLPTADAMKAEIQLHESNLDKVRVGLTAVVKVDAIPGKSFVGRVAKIAPLPNAQSIFMNPDLKIYGTEIHLEGRNPDLRTGMSCQAEIIIDRYDAATYVPIQAVLRIADQPMVYVEAGGGFDQRPVEIGLDNNRMVHIVSGLEVGQNVLLTPPLGAESAVEDEQLATDVEILDPLPSTHKQAEGGHRLESAAQSAEAAASHPESGSRPAAQGAAASRRQRRPTAEGERGSGRYGNMTEEQRAEMRQRYENMSPEEREAAMRRWRGQRNQGGAGHGGTRP